MCESIPCLEEPRLRFLRFVEVQKVDVGQVDLLVVEVQVVAELVWTRQPEDLVVAGAWHVPVSPAVLAVRTALVVPLSVVPLSVVLVPLDPAWGHMKYC